MTIVTLRLDRESEALLSRWLAERMDFVKNPKKSFHSTLLYTEETPLFDRADIRGFLEERLPLTLDPSTYDFRVYTPDCLVLIYRNAVVEEMRKTCYEQALHQLLEAEFSDEESLIFRRHLHFFHDLSAGISRPEEGVELWKGQAQLYDNTGDLVKNVPYQRMKFDSFSPSHITLATDFRESVDRLGCFDSPLTFDKVGWKQQDFRKFCWD